MTCQCLHSRSTHYYSALKGSKVGQCQVTNCPCLGYVKKAARSSVTALSPRPTCFRSGRSRGRPTEEQLWQEELAEEARIEAWKILIGKENKHGLPVSVSKPVAAKDETRLIKKPVEVIAKFMKKYGDTRVMVQKLRMRGKLKVRAGSAA